MIIHARNFVTSDDALGGSVIEKSLRFSRESNAVLYKAFSSAGNRKKWTWSGWVKFPNPNDSTTTQIFSYNQGNTNNRGSFYKGSTGVLNYQLRVGGSATQYRLAFVTTDAQLRDPSAWYHIVLVIDSDQGSSSDRVKIYINGDLQSVVYHNGPSSGFSTWINSTATIYMGAASDVNGGNMYLAEVNFIDGQAYDSSYFGFTDPVTGVWMPKRYEGTYGTNGFHLDFSDNSSTSALGKDTSGNGNDWTVTNFSVSAGKDNDSLEDTPTNNFCMINELDTYRSGNTVEEGGLKLTRTGSNFGNARGSMAVNSGKWYYEWECTGQQNQVGWVNTGFDINYNGGDVAVTSGGGGGVGMYWDSRTFMYGWQNSGGNSYFPSSGSFVTYTTGDIIMVAVDLDTFKFWFGKNGTWVNVLGTADPAAGTDGITPVASKNNGTYEAGMYFTPLISCFSNGSGYVNFGQRPFSYTIPSGYKTLQTRNIPLASTSIVRPQKHFDIITYTGSDTSAARTIDDLEFTPDLVWQKRRNGTNWHTWHDSVRGVGKTLYSNDTSAEGTNNQYGYISAFGTSGFTWSPGSTNNSDGNESSGTFVSWCWKAGGAAVSNSDGSITSQVSANTEAGFSIISYTGSGSNGATVGHGLGKTPSFLIIKSRSATGNWDVHAFGTIRCSLNLTEANQNNNQIQFANTTFTIPDTNANRNGSGVTYIAYCWAEIPGYSKMGSYEGNNANDGTFVFTGFSVRWLMIKRIDTTRDWVIYDSKRSTFNPIDDFLEPNNSTAEQTSSSNSVDFVSNGFKFRNNSGDMNGSGTYIYMAFAEHPGTTPFATFPNAR